MSADVRTYRVEVFRDSGLWVIECPELDIVSQTSTLANAERSARDLVAVWLDVPVESIAVQVDYSRVDPEAVSLAESAKSEALKAERIAARAAADRRTAARALVRKDGLSLRDAAAVLGVTYGRVQQLVGKA